MKKLLWIVMILMGHNVTAAPVETWSGAGPFACHGKCSLEWAETQLTETELAELRAVQADQPDPIIVSIKNDDVFTMASYFKDGAPVAYRTTTVAVLDQPTTAEGWHMDGWSFVKLHDCSNWTIVQHSNLYGAGGFTSRPTPPLIIVSTPKPDPIPWPTDDPHDPWPPIVWDPPTTPDPWTPIPPPEKPPVEMVVTPLPAGILLLLTGLAGLLMFKRRPS